MLFVLLAILTVVRSQTYNQSCILTPLKDKVLTPGQNASFHCETNDEGAYWIINRVYYSRPKYFTGSYLPFTLTKITMGNRTHLDAIIQTTNSSYNRGVIECACSLPGAGPLELDNKSIANWTTLSAYNLHTSYVLNSNVPFGVVEVQLPMDSNNGTLYYNIDMEDVETNINITTSGQEDFQVQNVSIITGRLRENRTYVVHMRAKFVHRKTWYLFNSTVFTTGGNMVPIDTLCSDSNSVQSTSVYTPTESYTLPSDGASKVSTDSKVPLTESCERDLSATTLTASVLITFFLTIILLAIISLIILCCCKYRIQLTKNVSEPPTLDKSEDTAESVKGIPKEDRMIVESCAAYGVVNKVDEASNWETEEYYQI